MAVREQAHINKIVNALLRELRGIADDGASYLTRPQAVKRVVDPSLLKGPFPAIGVRVSNITHKAVMGQQHQHTATIVIACVSQDQDDPEGEAFSLASDVQRLLRNNNALADDDGTQLVRKLDERQVEQDAEAVSGMAVVGITVEAEYQTDNSNP